VNIESQHVQDILAIGIDAQAHYMMSASSDNRIVIYSIAGQVLHTLDTKQNEIYSAAISPCGRFVASSGFTSDVKVWFVDFDKAATFRGVRRAFELTGHNSSIWTFTFTNDSRRMLTASKDGTFRVYDTDIRWQQDEAAHLLCAGEWTVLKSASARIVHAALSPDACAASISVGIVLRIYQLDDVAMKSGALPMIEIGDTYNACVYSRLLYTPDAAQLIVCGGEKHIRIYHNVAGLRAQLINMQSTRPTNDAHARRLKESIEELQQRIRAIDA